MSSRLEGETTSEQPSSSDRDRRAEPKILAFSAIRDPFDRLVVAFENLLEREVPKLLKGNHPDLVPYLQITFKLAMNDHRTVRAACADTDVDGILPKPEECLSCPPINRAIVDMLMSTTFLLENVDERWSWFRRSAWRDAKLEIEMIQEHFPKEPGLSDWVERFEQLVDSGSIVLSEKEKADPASVTRWPNPGGFIRYNVKDDDELPPLRRFLEVAYALFYPDLSQQAHGALFGVSKRGAPLILLKDLAESERRSELKGFRSQQLFLSMTALLAWCSVLDEFFALGRTAEVRFLWGAIGEYWPPAKRLAEVRFAAPLFAGA